MGSGFSQRIFFDFVQGPINGRVKRRMTNSGGQHFVCVFVEKKEKGRMERAAFYRERQGGT